jgi:Superfamily II DNA and RNA helicases
MATNKKNNKKNKKNNINNQDINVNSDTHSGGGGSAEEQDIFDEIEKFEDLEIDQKILRGVFSYGFETPSPIQKKAIFQYIRT